MMHPAAVTQVGEFAEAYAQEWDVLVPAEHFSVNVI